MITPDPVDTVVGELRDFNDGTHQVVLLTAPTAEETLTVVTSIAVGEDWLTRYTSEIWLAGITAEQEKFQPAIGLTWSEESDGWFALWQVFLHVNGKDPVQIAKVKPERGHTYQTFLSYDAGVGVLSWRVFDQTAGSLVTAGGCSDVLVDEAMTGAFAGVTPKSKQDGQTKVYVDDLQVYCRYVPVASRAQLCDGVIPTVKFERNEEPVIRLTVPGEIAPGQYFVRFANKDTGWVKEVGPILAEGAAKVVPLSLREFQPGQTRFEMTYIDQDHIWLSEAFDISIGRLTIDYERTEFDRDLQQVRSVAYISSDDRTENLSIEIGATFFRVLWDGTERTYREEEYSSIVAFTDALTLDEEKIMIPLVVDLPPEEDPGLWEVCFHTVSNPSIDTKELRTSYLFATYLPPAQTSEERPFSIVLLPDTQYYSRDFPQMFIRQTEWIAANAQEKNIRLMLHLGDITDQNTHLQWERANRSVSLLDGIVPYVLCVGNRDLAPSGQGGGVRDRTSTLFNRYFPAERYEALPWFGGVFQAGRHENSYYKFELGGEKVLVLSLEFGPRDEVLEWANQVVKTHEDYRVIMITHTYTSSHGSRVSPSTSGGGPQAYPIYQDPMESTNDGEQMWEKFVRKHANLWMVLSGHIDVSTMRSQVAVGDCGNFVYEILADYQSEPNGGNGWLVLMEFLDDHIVEVHAYSPYLGEYERERVMRGFTNHFMIEQERGLILQTITK